MLCSSKIMIQGIESNAVKSSCVEGLVIITVVCYVLDYMIYCSEKFTSMPK